MIATQSDQLVYLIEFVFLIFILVGVTVALDHFFPIPVEGESCQENPRVCCKVAKQYMKYCEEDS